MSKKSFTLPDLGEGVQEAEVLEIPVKVGQEIKEGEDILEIETDKAAVTIPSPYTGVITEILVAPGDLAEVGSALMVFSVGDAKAAEDVEPAVKAEHTTAAAGKRVPASPSTRRLARELGVDLASVTPTGSGGIVTADDVRGHNEKEDKREKTEQKGSGAIAQPVPPHPERVESEEPGRQERPLPDFTRWGQVTREPFTSIRRATAMRTSESWYNIPHAACHETVDITSLEAFRVKHKDEVRASSGGKLTLTLFAIKAAVTSLKTFPHFNASLDLAAREIVVKDYFHIGVATDTEHGLVVPVLRNVDRKSLKELSVELADLTARARTRALTREEMIGASFTITNAGALGGSYYTPIINYPEVAILGLGRARLQPAVVMDQRNRPQIEARLLMPLSLSFDHRVVDGADAIRFLQLIIDALQDPDELLMTMV